MLKTQLLKNAFIPTTLLLIVFLSWGYEESDSLQIKGISSTEFYDNHQQLLHEGNTLIIDGRTAEMFSGGHLKNAVNIDADDPDLELLLQQHLDEPLIVVYCTTIRRTLKIVNTLRSIYKGEIIFIHDGISGWKRNGLPLTNHHKQLNDSIPHSY